MIKKISNAIILLFLGLIVIGCSGDVDSLTQTPEVSPSASALTPTPTSEPYVAPVMTPSVNIVIGGTPYPGPGSGVVRSPVPPRTSDSYPAPPVNQVAPTIQEATPTIVSTGNQPYPGPATIITGNQPYPAPVTSTPGTIQASPTQALVDRPAGTLESIVSSTPSATARISKPLGTPPPPPATITIWHSWRGEQLAVFDFVIQSFQDLFPDVYFNLLYVPTDELYESYRQAAYYGRGPSILLGPSDWGAPLYDLGLVADLAPYTSLEFLSTINSAALETGIYNDALVSLPYAQRGVLLIRNNDIIGRSPETLEDMITLSLRATRGSTVGAYIELGSQFSTAHLEGLGGDLMNEDFNPVFNDQFGARWVELLLEFNSLGPTILNGNDDLERFKAGEIGFVIEGSWNLNTLVEALGQKSISIDPWPMTDGGRLSGYVQTDGLLLNANIAGDEQLAALRFMGYILDDKVQGLLSKAGFIPSAISAQPEDELIKAAMINFYGGTSYPVVPSNDYLRPYWDALNAAIQSILEDHVDPREALQIAQGYVIDRLGEIRHEP